jgi:hypothetical protein
MAIEGRLRDLALSDVFQLLELSRKTGTLRVQSDVVERSVVVRFEDGQVCGAEAGSGDERLGRLLVRTGGMSELDMRRALQAQRETPGTRFGTVAVRMGVADAAVVAEVLRAQVEQTVADLFRWKDGRFRFDEHGGNEPDDIQVRIPPRTLLMEAMRRSDEWREVSPEVSNGDAVPAFSARRDAGTLDLRPEEWEVLAAIDGERTLSQIARALGRPDIEVARTVDGLLSSHAVILVDSARADAPTGTDAASALAEAASLLDARRTREAAPVVERLLAEYSGEARAHLLAGRLYLQERRWPEAGERLRRAVRLDPLLGEAHFHLGFACARAGDHERAEGAWTTFLRLPGAAGPKVAIARAALDAARSLRTALEAGAT